MAREPGSPRRPQLPPPPDPEPEPWAAPGTRSRPFWATARLAGILAVALVVLVGVAIVMPGTGRPAPLRSPVAALPSASPTPSASAGPSSVRPTPTPTPLPSALDYAVQPGDSLTSIARMFRTTGRSIAFWNRDRYPSLDPDSEAYEPDRIEVGWTLLVMPGVEYDEPAATDGPAVSSAAPSRPGASASRPADVAPSPSPSG